MEITFLNQIKNIFLNKNETIKGKKEIDNYLKKGDIKGLSYLLRDFRDPKQDRITSNETWKRDHVDFFIDYFSVISLARLSGVLNEKILDEDKKSILTYLGNKAVKNYYQVFYKLLLPQILYEEVKYNFRLKTNNIDANKAFEYFNNFLVLKQSIDDSDVYQFLWFLDNGWSQKININNLNLLLRNPARVSSKLRSQDDGPLSCALRGYFKFVAFIIEYNDFLKSINEYPVIQSAYWHQFAYWFKSYKKKLNISVDITYNSLKPSFPESLNVDNIDQQQTNGSLELEMTPEKIRENIYNAFENIFNNTQYENELLSQMNDALSGIKLEVY